MSKLLGTFKTRKNGNSLIVTIPKDVGWDENQTVKATVDEKGNLTYSPINTNPWDNMEHHDFKKDIASFEFEVGTEKHVGRENI